MSNRWKRLFFYPILTGLAGGLAAAAMEWGLHFGTAALIGTPVPLDAFATFRFGWGILLLPAIGCLVCGVVVPLLCRGSKQQGTDAVIHAFHRNNGNLPLREPVVKGIAAVGVISCGGSAGPEGPIAALGASLGSACGRLFGVPPRQLRISPARRLRGRDRGHLPLSARRRAIRGRNHLQRAGIRVGGDHSLGDRVGRGLLDLYGPVGARAAVDRPRAGSHFLFPARIDSLCRVGARLRTGHHAAHELLARRRMAHPSDAAHAVVARARHRRTSDGGHRLLFAAGDRHPLRFHSARDGRPFFRSGMARRIGGGLPGYSR